MAALHLPIRHIINWRLNCTLKAICHCLFHHNMLCHGVIQLLFKQHTNHWTWGCVDCFYATYSLMLTSSFLFTKHIQLTEQWKKNNEKETVIKGACTTCLFMGGGGRGGCSNVFQQPREPYTSKQFGTMWINELRSLLQDVLWPREADVAIPFSI